jgi:RNA polymerase sigma factor (sigma-70 family)
MRLPNDIVDESAQSWAAFLCDSCFDTLQHTARRSLFDAVRLNAEDLVAGVIADVACGEFRELPTSPPAVLAFAKSVVRNRARHTNRDACRFADFPDELLAHHRGYDPWERVVRAIVRRDIESAFSSLTPRERQVSTLHWLEQWSAAEIAAHFGTSLRTVKELLRRSAQKLRCSLSCHREGHADALRRSA